MGPDGWIDHYLSDHPPSAFLTTLGDFFNRIGKGDLLAFFCILFVLAGYLLGKQRWIKSGSGGLFTLLVVTPVVQVLKHLFGRARPQMHLGDFHFIGPNLIKNGFDSLPSGHAIASFALATFFSYYYPNLKNFFYLTALTISILGRVVLRHHFLSDVVVGGILGIGIGLFCAKKLKNWIDKNDADKFSLPNSGADQATDSTSPTDTKQLRSDHGAQNSFLHLLALIAFSSIILFTGLNNSALWDRDETEYAQAAIEMRQKNEWLIPTLEGQPFIEKPILLYWLVRVSAIVFGVNEFSARFPSALFAVLTTLGTYFLGKSLWNNRVGFFSALTLSSSFLFAGSFRLLLTDPPFVFFTLLSFIFYIHSLRKPESFKRCFALCYGSIGLGILSKGPIALFPMPVFFIYEWLHRENSNQLSYFRKILRHFLFLTLALLIACPWFLYSFSVQKDATKTFFLYENLHRFLKGSEGHTGPMIYYLPILLFGFFPWSFFLFPYVRKEWNAKSSRGLKLESRTLLLSVWILFIFTFFSFSAHKLPHYMLPLLPPLACLTGKFWDDQIFTTPTSFRFPFLATIAFSFCLALAPAAFYFFRPHYASSKLMLPFLLFFSSLLTAFAFANKKEWGKSFGTICIGSIILFVSFSILSLPAIEEHRVMKPIGIAIKKNVPQDADLIGYQVSEPSLFIYSGRLFKSIENTPLESLLAQTKPLYVVIKESALMKSSVQPSYKVVERKEGFAENGGEMTLLLITNGK